MAVGLIAVIWALGRALWAWGLLVLAIRPARGAGDAVAVIGIAVRTLGRAVTAGAVLEPVTSGTALALPIVVTVLGTVLWT